MSIAARFYGEKLIPVVAPSKARVCGRSLAGIAGSNPAGDMDVSLSLSLVSVVCCQVEVCAMGRLLVQRSPTESGVSECDLETSIMGRPRPIEGCWAIKKIVRSRFQFSLRILVSRQMFSGFL